MMITQYAICDSRPHLVEESYAKVYPWGSTDYACCDACRSIVSARFSWMEVYA